MEDCPTYTNEERAAIQAEFDTYMSHATTPTLHTGHLRRCTSLFGRMLTLGEMYGRMYNSSIITKDMFVEMDGEMMTYEILGMRNLIKCLTDNMKGSQPPFNEACLSMKPDSPWIPSTASS